MSPLPGTLDTFQTFEDAGQSPPVVSWEQNPISGLSYTGAWDVSTSQTVPNNTYADGDYLILSSSGDDNNGNSWNKGDWCHLS